MGPLRRCSRTAAGLGVAAALLAPSVATGGSVVRFEPPATALSPPAVGRGYDRATGELAGNCFVTVVASAPSVDFRYRLDAMTDEEVATAGRPVVGSGPPRHHLRLALSFRAYDRSLDESASVLAPEALALVRRGDLVGFFEACGTSYVRALTRVASFESMLSYQSSHDARDHRFEQELDAWLKSWTPGREDPARPDRGFAYRATGNRLSITTRADGLGAYARGQLVAADVAGLRAAAEAVFRAVRHDDAGRVVEIEVAPWTEHPAFVAALADGEVAFRAGAPDDRPPAVRRRWFVAESLRRLAASREERAP